MSLEVAGFIKDLVATNPEGTDPKSQGDDHLRLIKGVLQSQFSGLTEGAAIIRTESDFNAMLTTKPADLAPVNNINAALNKNFWGGITAATTGTAPPNGFAEGDILQNMAYNASHVVQLYFEASNANFPIAWIRRWNGTAFSLWQPLYEETLRQNYTFGSGYSAGTAAAFRRLNKVVSLEGAINRSSPIGSGQTVATLPVGWRPQFETGVFVMAQYTNLATQAINLQILPSGVIQTSYVVTLAGTPSGNCSFWLNAQFQAAPL